ncbi:unnamed protein product [Urochloa decumbens]|uniref:Uncharacterized protein n=1 Tax=Urochloa decumbens TaxID=240449 RepID=A0ABC8Z9P5_9POAL
MAPARIGSIRREKEEAPMDAGAAELSLAGLLGIVTCAMAITLAVRDPPPGLDKNAYLFVLTGAFFAAVAGIIAVFRASNNPRARRAVRASVGALAVVVGLSAATLLLW